jgi:hypothetical protein
LVDLPHELDALLDWFDTEADQATLATDVRAYADELLAGLRSDQAVIPELDADAARTVALVLTHHIRNPEHCGAWLNLGFGLRRLAISDSEAVKALRLERALGCFDRALALSREHRPVAIRAWAGSMGRQGPGFPAARTVRGRSAVRPGGSEPGPIRSEPVAPLLILPDIRQQAW